jgi:hypothetical protein
MDTKEYKHLSITDRLLICLIYLYAHKEFWMSEDNIKNMIKSLL